MHRLGIVLGGVAAIVMSVFIRITTWPNQPSIEATALVSLVVGVIVWLVFLGLGWAIRGFQPPGNSK
jgi:hypothetical protein